MLPLAFTSNQTQEVLASLAATIIAMSLRTPAQSNRAKRGSAPEASKASCKHNSSFSNTFRVLQELPFSFMGCRGGLKPLGFIQYTPSTARGGILPECGAVYTTLRSIAAHYWGPSKEDQALSEGGKAILGGIVRDTLDERVFARQKLP